MVTKCANPCCDTFSRYLRGGRLFLFEAPPTLARSNWTEPEIDFRQTGPQREYFWLCEQCAKSMIVVSRATEGCATVVRKNNDSSFI